MILCASFFFFSSFCISLLSATFFSQKSLALVLISFSGYELRSIFPSCFFSSILFVFFLAWVVARERGQELFVLASPKDTIKF